MNNKNNKKLISAEIVKKSGLKTYKVKTVTRIKHPTYKKIVNKTKCFLVHSNDETYNIGDLVEIQSTRPLSKNKCWVIKGKNK